MFLSAGDTALFVCARGRAESNTAGYIILELSNDTPLAEITPLIPVLAARISGIPSSAARNRAME